MSKQFIREYFTFSRAERKGIIILVVLIIMTLVFRLVLPVLMRQSHGEKSTFDEDIREWITTVTENETAKADSVNTEDTGNINISLFDFDPNVISSDGIKKLGVSDNVRKAWVKYRVKGGRFYRKEDLKKVYGLDSVTYERLEPYIISGKKMNQRTTGNQHANRHVLTIELNNATQEEFERLIGIGPVLARRICKYRNLLGGFYRISQLNEVFGITDSIVKINENLLSIDKSVIEKININGADFRTLSRHPYISDYEAKAILHYREMKGFIESSNELVLNNLISDSVFVQLTDYLIIEEL